MPDVKSSSGPNIDNLRRLVALRYIVIAGQALALFGASRVSDWAIQVVPVALTLVVFALVNLLTHIRLRHTPTVTNPELFGQLLVDVAALTAVLYFTGGSANPFVSLYLLPLIVAATLLPPAFTWSMAALTAACYTALMFFNMPLTPHHAGADNIFGMHILGMWFTFVLSAGLIAHFAVRMARSLRERDRLLAAAREESLRNERIVALGTLAAGAAHELGTPLNTMALVAEELASCCAEDPAAAGGISELSLQIANCKRIITELLASAGRARSETGSVRPVTAFFEDITAKWRLLRPSADLQLRWAGDLSQARILAEPTLSQAIVNLLNNAADVSARECAVELLVRRDLNTVVIEICDRGPGLTPDAMRSAGQLFFTTKSPAHGLGLGLFLANATIDRFGGTMRLCNRDGGGACTRVVLPLME